MPNVLVIDDVEDQRELLSQLLTRAGCRVVLASGTQSAVDAVGLEPFDIIVIDLLLGGSDDGWTTMERLRALVPDAALVISSVLDVAEFPPADAFLPKPFTGSQVRELVDRLQRRS